MTYEFDAALWLWTARQADSWTFVLSLIHI